MVAMSRAALLACFLVGLCCFHATADQPLRDVIDQHVAAGWQANNIAPASPAPDAEFLRRVTLDLTGVIPAYDQAVAFLDDAAADKRAKLVERLLADPRYAVHQADVWDMVYFGRNPPGYKTNERDGFQAWLRKQFQENTPYDQWAGDILRAEGNSVEQGPSMFFAQYKSKPEDATEAVTQRFLGVQLQCARCHDHPFDKWSQLDFYGMAAFLARLRVVDLGKKGDQQAFAIGEMNLGEIEFTGPVTEDDVGKEGKAVAPRFLAGEALEEPALPEDFKEDRNFPGGKMPPAPKFSRKNALADWIASGDNPYFAKAAVNRVWAQFMGKGLVSPVDNLSDENPASHPELLDEMAAAFIAHDFDMKWLIHEIVSSKAYQLSSAGPVADAHPQWYQQARSRPLSAEELLESWVIAADFRQVLENNKQKPKDRLDFRGITWDYLRRAFGQPSDGAGNFQGGMGEHLYLNNGQIHTLISDRPGGLHEAISKSDEAWEAKVERLYLQILSRRPTPAETEKFVAYLSAEDDPATRLKEAMWTLMSCSEFRFNH